MSVSEEEFRRALACFASGVNVVTTVDGAGELHGITVSAFCSVSLDPPLVLICIEKATASHYAFAESGAFIVNILSESQADLSEHFATPFADKFSGVRFTPGLDGIPILSGTLGYLECRIKTQADGGDHSIFVAGVENTSISGGSPLIYFSGAYHRL